MTDPRHEGAPRRRMRCSVWSSVLPLFLMMAAVACGQDDSGYHLEMKVEPQGAITIGGEVTLFIRIDHDRDFTLIPPSPPLVLEPFEFKRFRKPAQKKVGGQIRESFTIICTVFELGELTVPRIPFTLVGRGRTIALATDETPVTVVSVLKPGDEEFRPIKGPVSLDVPWYEHYTIWLLVLLILLCLLYLYLRRKRKGQQEEEEVELLDPATEAMKALHELYQKHAMLFMEVPVSPSKNAGKMSDSAAAIRAMREKVVQQDPRISFQTSMKPFHLELSGIFRRYLRRRFGFHTFEKTSSELVVLAKTAGFQDDLAAWMERILKKSDYFKFSARGASLKASQELWEHCWSFVVHTDGNPLSEAEENGRSVEGRKP